MNNPNVNNPDVAEALKEARDLAEPGRPVSLDNSANGPSKVESSRVGASAFNLNGLRYPADAELSMSSDSSLPSQETVGRVVRAQEAQEANVSASTGIDSMQNYSIEQLLGHVRGVGMVVSEYRQAAVSNSNRDDFSLAA